MVVDAEVTEDEVMNEEDKYFMPFSVLMLLEGNKIGVTLVVLGIVLSGIVVFIKMVDDIICCSGEVLSIGLVILVCVVFAESHDQKKKEEHTLYYKSW